MLQVHSEVIQLYKYTYIIFEIIFHHRLLQDIDHGSLNYTVNLCCLLHIYFFLIRNLLLFHSHNHGYTYMQIEYKWIALVPLYFSILNILIFVLRRNKNNPVNLNNKSFTLVYTLLSGKKSFQLKISHTLLFKKSYM